MNHGRRMSLGLFVLAAFAYMLARLFPPPEDNGEVPRQPTEQGPSDGPEVLDDRPGVLHRAPGRRQAIPRPASPTPAREAAGVPFTSATIHAAFDGAQPALRACAHASMEGLEVSEDFSGRLLMEVDLAPGGIDGVSLVDVQGVPEPMLECFSGVVYTIAWPLPGEATTITMPFALTAAP